MPQLEAIVIPPVELATCTACETEFDVNAPERMRIFQKLHAEEQMHMWPCDFLLTGFDDHAVVSELYPTPWVDKPKEAWFCSEQCETDYLYTGDFQYRQCGECSRMVCQQNPSNGWMWQFREHAELGDICLRCYESEILRNGQPRCDFESDHIGGGMFFNGGNPEPKAKGFREVPGFRNFYVTGSDTARRYNAEAIELIDRHYKVITCYESLAIGGLEGFITMMAKRSHVCRKESGPSNGGIDYAHAA